jgi:hypothetical protein
VKRAAVALLFALATPAWAKTTRELGYRFDQVFPALVRFLRVDEKLKLTEKDEGAGYVLFELVDGKKTFAGAAEVAKLDGGGSRVSVRISDRPAYMELGILERFADRLHEDLGDPPPPAPASQPASQPAEEPAK